MMFMSTVGPRFIIDPVASQEVVINGEFSLTCRAEGFPRPSIIWFMNNTMISNGVQSDVNMSMTVLTSTLTISNANFNDSGMYYCEAVSSEFTNLNVTSGIGIITVVGMLSVIYHQCSPHTSIVVCCCVYNHFIVLQRDLWWHLKSTMLHWVQILPLTVMNLALHHLLTSGT